MGCRKGKVFFACQGSVFLSSCNKVYVMGNETKIVIITDFYKGFGKFCQSTAAGARL